MKKLLVLLLVVVSINSIAQEKKYGLKLGLNVSNIYGYDKSFDSRVGGHFGLILRNRISENISIQPELLYSTQGVTEETDNVDITMKLDYLNLPLMFQFHTNQNFALEVGPQFGYLLNAEIKGEQGDNSESVDIKDDCNKLDLGLNLGVQYETESGFIVHARYNLGISNIFEDDNEDGDNGKHSVISLGIGFRF